jgi:hypothetical protein
MIIKTIIVIKIGLRGTEHRREKITHKSSRILCGELFPQVLEGDNATTKKLFEILQ